MDIFRETMSHCGGSLHSLFHPIISVVAGRVIALQGSRLCTNRSVCKDWVLHDVVGKASALKVIRKQVLVLGNASDVWCHFEKGRSPFLPSAL